MHINYYGFFIVLGILAGCWVVEKVKNKFLIHDSSFMIQDLFLWVLIPGIVGARLYHVIDYWWYYRENLRQITYVWNGGLGIFGGILGGIIGLWIFLKLKIKNEKLKVHELFLSYLDLIVIGLPLGQAIGRWGNYFNQELYGLPTNLPWGIFIRPENRLPGFENFSYFHPLFLYESLGCLIIFLILLALLKLFCKRAEVDTNFYSVFQSSANDSNQLLRSSAQDCKQKNTHKNCISPRASGMIFFTYLFFYSFLRFFLEFLRIDPWRVGVFTVAQWLSLFFMVSALIFSLYKKKAWWYKR